MKQALSIGLAAGLGSAYAAYLSSDEGKKWIDENTTVGVIIGVGLVLAVLRFGLDGESWRTVRGAFVAAGAPMIVRKILKVLG